MSITPPKKKFNISQLNNGGLVTSGGFSSPFVATNQPTKLFFPGDGAISLDEFTKLVQSPKLKFPSFNLENPRTAHGWGSDECC